MEDVFEIEDKGNHKLLVCRQRKLEVLVTERLDIPEYPAHFLIVFSTIRKKKGLIGEDVVVCFAAMDYDGIDYEPYFKHLLVTNAINHYMAEEWHMEPGELTYSNAYKKAFIDTMSLDTKKMTPQLRGYLSRDPAEEAIDFFTWKEKYWNCMVN